MPNIMAYNMAKAEYPGGEMPAVARTVKGERLNSIRWGSASVRYSAPTWTGIPRVSRAGSGSRRMLGVSRLHRPDRLGRVRVSQSPFVPIPRWRVV